MLACCESSNAVRWTVGERLEDLFEERCDAMLRSGKGHYIAIETDGCSYTFKELDDAANQLARYLKSSGVQPGARVGLIFDKTIETYVALLAVLKVQAAYVPLDAGFPEERIQFIVEDASVTAILTMGCFRDRFAKLDLIKIFVDEEAHNIEQMSSTRLSCAEKGEVVDQLCYVIYTSGTTGKPKGVAVDHASICNFVRVANDVYRYAEGDRVYQGMTIAFDFSVEELWVPLMAGATLVPGQPGANLVGEELGSYLKSKRITGFCCVPTLLATLDPDLPDLRFILVSGEACPQSLVERWCRPTLRMVNAYGPTEATVTATVTELTAGKAVTIGAPLPTYTIVILDPEVDRAVADGELGEIGIAGVGLAREYLNRPELTAQKFVPDPLNISNNPSRRIYRTGDIGRITASGEVEFHGRIDTQIKIRGYRIELAEIEALLEKLPEINQAVVNPYALDASSPELVAYYTLKAGFSEPRAETIIPYLRQHLPSYMIPTYVEKLSAIPMTSSTKVDRKALPRPTTPRVALAMSDYVAPETDLEKLVVEALRELLDVERISVKDNFFQDLGGHSLLMARFCSDIRRKLELSSISMRDVYLHPTVEQLCCRIAELQNNGSVFDLAPPASFTPSRLSYFACGTAQLLTYITLGVAGILFLEYAYHLTLAPELSLRESVLRIIALSVTLFVVLTATAIALKWLVVGKFRPGSIPLWGWTYFRLWFANLFVQTAPPNFFAGTPIYNIYLRMLGARIGSNTVIRAKALPLCTDLLSIGSNTIVRSKSLLSTHVAQNNLLQFGSISLGNDVVVGEGSVICLNTSIGDGGQLGHASSLQSGQTIPPNKHFHGSPAQETTSDYGLVDTKPCSWLRRTLFSTFLLSMAFLAVPAAVLLAYYFFVLLQIYVSDFAPLGTPTISQGLLLARDLGAVTLLLLIFAIVVGLAMSFLLPRLLNKFLRTDRTYVMYGFHHLVQGMIASITAAPFFNLIFGDSSAIVYYLKLAGYRLKEVVQTGANFGLDQTQDNPLLCEIGVGTMVSDGLQIVNAMSSPTSFTLNRARIGKNNYLGNYIIFPSNAKTDDDCLLATKVMLPIDGKVRRGVGLLGSPSFEIPRAVERDTCFGIKKNVDLDLLARKNKVNAATVALLLSSIWAYAFIAVSALHLGFYFYRDFGVISVISAAYFLGIFSILYFVFLERASIGFGQLSTRVVSMYDPYFLFHERHWKFCATPLQQLFSGTPLRNLMCRMLGVKLGKMVFNDGCQFYDKTLIEVGDYANLNAFSMFQAHSLEEGVFKSDRIKIGDRCSIGANALVHYGVDIGDDVIVQPDSFVMKGEVLESGTVWCGNPAKATGRIKYNRPTTKNTEKIFEAGPLTCGPK